MEWNVVINCNKTEISALRNMLYNLFFYDNTGKMKWVKRTRFPFCNNMKVLFLFE